MIVVDTSALAAILLSEGDSETYLAAIEQAASAKVGAPSAFELRLIVQRKLGPDYQSAAELLLAAARIEIVAWTAAMVPLATAALLRFGGRPARLNYGDCMSYALAKSLGAPLLYKGNDFARTDIRSAL